MVNSSTAVSARGLCWILAVAVTLVSIGLHIENYKRAGALWRDEVNTVELARETIFSTYSQLQFDSFPLLWFAVLGRWMRWAGADDNALRFLGLLVGLSVLTALWINAWIFSRRPPVLSLMLIALSATVIRYGGSLRGHGLGLLTGLLMFGSMWHLIEKQSTSRIVAATALSLLAVHSSFYNAVFLLAAALGATAVGIRNRSQKLVIVPLLIGFACAVSMLPYVPTILSTRAWNDLIRHEVGLSWFFAKWKETAELSGTNTWVMWGVVVLAAIGVSLVTLKERDRPQRDYDLALFCIVTIASGVLFYWAFLETLSYRSEPWYYITLLGLLAGSVDPVFGLVQNPRTRVMMTVPVAILAALAIAPVWGTIQESQTNIDTLAKRISAEASPQDLVFVFPWQNGVSFQRYYHGSASWHTVPPVDFHRWHRYDLLQRVVSDPQALDRFLNETKRKLDRGGTVWLVAPSSMLGRPETKPLILNQPRLAGIEHVWGSRLSALLSQNRIRITTIPPRPGVGKYERLVLDIGKIAPTAGNDD